MGHPQPRTTLSEQVFEPQRLWAKLNLSQTELEPNKKIRDPVPPCTFSRARKKKRRGFPRCHDSTFRAWRKKNNGSGFRTDCLTFECYWATHFGSVQSWVKCVVRDIKNEHQSNFIHGVFFGMISFLKIYICIILIIKIIYTYTCKYIVKFTYWKLISLWSVSGLHVFGSVRLGFNVWSATWMLNCNERKAIEINASGAVLNVWSATWGTRRPSRAFQIIYYSYNPTQLNMYIFSIFIFFYFFIIFIFIIRLVDSIFGECRLPWAWHGRQLFLPRRVFSERAEKHEQTLTGPKNI